MGNELVSLDYCKKRELKTADSVELNIEAMLEGYYIFDTKSFEMLRTWLNLRGIKTEFEGDKGWQSFIFS